MTVHLERTMISCATLRQNNNGGVELVFISHVQYQKKVSCYYFNILRTFFCNDTFEWKRPFKTFFRTQKWRQLSKV